MDDDAPAPDAAVLEARLAAAQARAEAAEARAAAAEAAAEAAEAQAAALEARTDRPTAAAEASAPGVSAPEATPAAPSGAAPALSGLAEEVRAGYSSEGPVLALGALVEDGSAVPGAPVGLPLATMNRHGLVAGATGTGKTRTLQLMAEGLSAAGVPTFLADIKGDLSGMATPGAPSDRLLGRAAEVGQAWQPTAFPVQLLTLGGLGTGTPVRTTVTDFGPLLLARVLGLNATQESSLQLVFHWADAQGLALLDLADLRSTIAFLVSDEGKPELRAIGGISTATAGVILREVAGLQAQGADTFFGEPAFQTADLLGTTADGRGVVTALQLPAVQDRPALFSTFLMWLLADLFEELPEVGDVERPRLVFFFDEAHLLFTGASRELLASITHTVRLIRSKGVGVWFVTQTPKDVPDDVLAQLGGRVQHALRAHTPDDAAALRATVRTYPRSAYDLEELLTTLSTGEAVVTVLSEKGAPTPVAWTRLRAPQSAMDPSAPDVLAALVAASPLHARYATPVDRESAHELLVARAEATAEQARRAAEDETRRQELEEIEKDLRRPAPRGGTSRSGTTRARSRGSDPLDAFLRSVGTTLGREITRTVLGTRRRR
ncbi:helicase HerA-like domain-containing protein [Actinotalea sp. Marseille-Q4924]|uniref:helicase HerA-like domain-containing protein n=1 Tax=Actinotalea sp. Marseille-Q4924 TaxID=2866571 RepID=UPI001CE402C2|nr:helicase HerA-like domain-containing protein [Actinotalea sp. Marseille-Q4924]